MSKINYYGVPYAVYPSGQGSESRDRIMSRSIDIRNAAAWLDRNPAQDPDGLALIYAWDEVNEGGFLIPTKGEGFKMLEGLKEAVDIINADGR